MNYGKPKKKRIVTPELALTKLMVMTSRGEKCSGDAVKLLTRWEIDEREQAKIISRLIADKWIDDSRYANAFVRDKSNHSSWGRYKIKNALQIKGVDKDVIEQALNEIDNDSSSENLIKLLEKKARSTKFTNLYDLKGKLFRYAMSRGFEFSEITDAMDGLDIEEYQ